MDQAIVALRSFNRFHTRFVGALDPQYLGSGMTLVEARLLYEIAQRQDSLASDLKEELDLDAGYLSRLLRRFEARGWIERGRGDDARQRPIMLTASGREAFAALDDRTRNQVAERLEALGPTDRQALIGALGLVRTLLGDAEGEAWSMRTFRPGDLAMIAARQSILYAEGWGWGLPMEVLQGEVTTDFLRNFKPGREQCWIAERGGIMAGSVLLVDGGEGIAKLRLLYTEPWARGLGIGEALVAECVAFARAAGYDKISLWTHTILTSARRIYEAHGFRIVSVDMHNQFGEPVQGETWELALNP